MSNLPLLTRPTITLRDFLTEMEAAISRNPWLDDAPLRITKRIEDINGDVVSEGPETVTSVSSGCTASAHYILLK